MALFVSDVQESSEYLPDLLAAWVVLHAAARWSMTHGRVVSARVMGRPALDDRGLVATPEYGSSTMYGTAEVRWILPGAMPTAIARWFYPDGGGNDVEPETRTDRYVVLPGCDSVGIKLRGTDSDGPARLDVKTRIGDATELRLTPEVTGEAAAWTKWTLVVADQAAIVSGLELPTPVSTVHKRRLVGRYTIEGDRIREIPIDEDVDDGCEIELCYIRVDGIDEPWWSLGLEAFGPPERVWDTLLSVGRGWFGDHGTPPLDATQRFDRQTSSPYPAWLSGRLTEVRHEEA